MSLILIIRLTYISPVYSRSSQEIGNEINDKKNKLTENQKLVEDLNKEIEKLQSESLNLSNGIPLLQIQVEIVTLEIDRNKKELEGLIQSNQIKELEKIKRVKLQHDSVTKVYKDWRATPFNEKFLETGPISKNKLYVYSNYSLGKGQDGIDDLVGVIGNLNTQINSSNSKINDLTSEANGLESKKFELEQTLIYYQNVANLNASTVANLLSEQQTIEKEISNLLEEQKSAAENEARLLAELKKRKKQEIVDGDFIVTGTGRDLYQGHSVGMSQWGAYGGAKAGMSAEEILKFYYTDVVIEKREGNIDVIGYGTMDNDVYVAGLGEIPSWACAENEEVIKKWEKYADKQKWEKDDPRRNKYVLDDPNNIWDCWPEESIKAQVIAARSYAMSNGGPICVTAACQVYDGHKNKMWASLETENEVLVSVGSTHTNQIIRALYSADNSQGAGSANNDTMFQSVNGEGTPFSYLRAKNDTGFAQTSQWTYWEYDTNSYKLEDLTDMVKFGSKSNDYTEDVKSYFSNLLKEIGELSEVSFERDPSGRVKKVWFIGANGNSVSIGGWWFKNLWNNWVHKNETYDYIYSQSFYLTKLK